MRFVRTLLLGSALLSPRVLAAQDSTAAGAHPPISASHLAAAHELIGAMHMADAAAAGVQVALDQQIRVNPAMERYRTAMKEWANAVFTGKDAQDAFATMYAENFTEDEIRQLIAFYHTPVGQKAAMLQATLGLRGAELGRRLAQEHQAELMQRLQAVESAPPKPAQPAPPKP
jgi:hypothetical protein